MAKIIIHFENCSELEAIKHVSDLVRMGRISESRHGDMFCAAESGGGFSIFADKTKSGTDVFRVYKK